MKLEKNKRYFLHLKSEYEEDLMGLRRVENKKVEFYGIAKFIEYLENNSLVSVAVNCRFHTIENNLIESTDSYNRYKHPGFEYIQLSEITVENFHNLFPDKELPEGVTTDSQLLEYYLDELSQIRCY